MLKHPVRGVGLIELLVAIVICSMGLLALAAVHAASLRYARLTLHRAIAIQLAQDMAERMRANGAYGSALLQYQYKDTDFSTQEQNTPAAPANVCERITDNCSQAERKDADLYQWRMLARALLPSGSVFLLPDTGTMAGNADLWVAWREVVRSQDELNRLGNECPTGLNVANDLSVRCQFMRVRL